jgi:hypothetical protein
MQRRLLAAAEREAKQEKELDQHRQWAIDQRNAVHELRLEIEALRATARAAKAKADKYLETSEHYKECVKADYAEKIALRSRQAELLGALKGMLAEWEKFTRYGSPLAKASNENVARAQAAIKRAEEA